MTQNDRHWGQAHQGAPPAQRYVNGRLVRSTGFVDENGMFYPLPKSRIWPVIQTVCIGIILAAAVVFVLPLLVAPPLITTSQSPLGTAEVRPRPTPPRRDAPAPASVPIFADDPQPTPYDNAAYNATAQASKDILIVVTPTEEDRWADGEFWTEEEKAAFAATDVAIAQATTTAFIENVPTPAPDVVIEMEQKCADAALVARSPLLQLWCTPED